MNALKKIIAVFCSIAMSFSLLSVPAVALTGEEVSVGLGILSFAYELFKDWKEAHPNTPDSEYPGFNPGGMFGGGVSRDELNQKYDTYVETLPAQGYNSSGKLLWQPKVSDISNPEDAIFDGHYISSIPWKGSNSVCSILFSGNGFSVDILVSNTRACLKNREG